MPEGLLARVLRSPELVKRKDKEGWLELFSPDAKVEDPVGAGAHQGTAALSRFWDVFIAPQRAITFAPRHDFVHGDTVIRYVTISTLTPVSPDVPFEIPALIEYRVRDDQIVSLRAFWEAALAVKWHLGKGLRGAWALSKHSGRTMGGLGLGASLGFGRALKPALTSRDARRIVEDLASAMADRAAWRRFCGDARVRVMNARESGAAWDETVHIVGRADVEEVIRAGDYIACVLTSQATRVAGLIQCNRSRIVGLDLLVDGSTSEMR